MCGTLPEWQHKRLSKIVKAHFIHSVLQAIHLNHITLNHLELYPGLDFVVMPPVYKDLFLMAHMHMHITYTHVYHALPCIHTYTQTTHMQITHTHAYHAYTHIHTHLHAHHIHIYHTHTHTKHASTLHTLTCTHTHIHTHMHTTHTHFQRRLLFVHYRKV